MTYKEHFIKISGKKSDAVFKSVGHILNKPTKYDVAQQIDDTLTKADIWPWSRANKKVQKKDKLKKKK